MVFMASEKALWQKISDWASIYMELSEVAVIQETGYKHSKVSIVQYLHIICISFLKLSALLGFLEGPQ